MKKFYFYKFEVSYWSSPKIDINNIINTLKEENPETNFIKFYYGNERSLIFLTDQLIKSKIFKILIRMDKWDQRPGITKIGMDLIRGGLTIENLKNYYINSGYSYLNSGFSFYQFGPNPKEVFNKHFSSQALGSIAYCIYKFCKR